MFNFKSLSVFVFAVAGLSMVHDSFAALTCRNNTTGQRSCTYKTSCPTGWTKVATTCSTTTVGGSLTYITHHDKAIKCTWQEFQGEWSSAPGDGTQTNPMTVSHTVEGDGNYATCSGWDETGPTPPPPASPNTPYPHNLAPYGSGKFLFQVKYESAAPLSCIEDPNSGIGNNCVKFTDANNKPKGGGGTAVPGASRACALNSPSGGTTLTFQYACADGVKVTGFLTLVPRIDGNPQPAPVFTGPCTEERVAEGACTMQLGGIPTKTVRVKGQDVTVVDADACAAAFPATSVPNSLGSSQSQLLDAKEILFYKEVAEEGICDAQTNLPTVPGLPAAAYSRYCQSDIGPFSDNVAPNIYPNPGELSSTAEGFDNELRVCPVGTDKVAHTAVQDAEQVALKNGAFIEPQGPLNLNCTTGGNTDSASYKVKIPDQAPLLAVNVDIMPLTDAPKLEGFAPNSAQIIIDGDGVRKLELRYATCGPTPGTGLSTFIKTTYNPTNNSNVTLHLTGKTDDVGLGPVLFQGEFTIKVNGI